MKNAILSYDSTERIAVFFNPALTGSKTPTSKSRGSTEVRWESTARKSPIGGS